MYCPDQWDGGSEIVGLKGMDRGILILHREVISGQSIQRNIEIVKRTQNGSKKVCFRSWYLVFKNNQEINY